MTKPHKPKAHPNQIDSTGEKTQAPPQDIEAEEEFKQAADRMLPGWDKETPNNMQSQ